LVGVIFAPGAEADPGTAVLNQPAG